MPASQSHMGSTAQKSPALTDVLIFKAALASTVTIGWKSAVSRTARKYLTKSPPTALAMSVAVQLGITGRIILVKRIL